MNKIKLNLIIKLVYFAVLQNIAFTQQNTTIEIKYENTSKQQVINSIDTNEVLFATNKIIHQLLSENYFTAAVDSINNSKNTIYISSGRQFTTKTIRYRTNFADSAILNNKELTQLSPSSLEIENSLQSQIKKLNQTGFPLAYAQYQIQEPIADTLVIDSYIKSGNKYTFGSFEQKLNYILHPKFLHHFLQIKYGQNYNQVQLDRINEKLSALPFLQVKDNPRIKFYGTEADIWLIYEKKPINSFDVLLGIAQKINSGITKYQLSGQVKAEFVNTFKWAETILVNYENLNESSPKLKTFLSFPYIRIAPLGISNQFELFKQKEEFLLLQTKTNLFYNLDQNQSIGLLVNTESNTILQIDTTSIIRSKKLPLQLDYKILHTGLSYSYTNLNDRYNPSKGNKLKVEIKTGNRKYLSNPSIVNTRPELSSLLQQQYDSLNKTRTQLSTLLEIDCYLKFTKRNIIKLSAKNQSIFFASVSDNQKYRLGGYQTLRGFDEEIFISPSYFIETAEYRFLLDQNSFLSAFLSTAQISSTQSIDDRYKQFFSTGIGLQFKTNIGFFNFLIAAGTDEQITYNYQNTKVHFGYVSLF